MFIVENLRYNLRRFIGFLPSFFLSPLFLEYERYFYPFYFISHVILPCEHISMSGKIPIDSFRKGIINDTYGVNV